MRLCNFTRDSLESAGFAAQSHRRQYIDVVSGLRNFVYAPLPGESRRRVSDGQRDWPAVASLGGPDWPSRPRRPSGVKWAVPGRAEPGGGEPRVHSYATRDARRSLPSRECVKRSSLAIERARARQNVIGRLSRVSLFPDGRTLPPLSRSAAKGRRAGGVSRGFGAGGEHDTPVRSRG